MTIHVYVAPEFARYVSVARVRSTARKALRAEKTASLSLSVVVLGNRALRDYNRRYGGTNRATDVLAFPSDEDGYLGDILISYEMARANARRVGWRVRDELDLLVIHGVLHLLGYDDVTAAARARMWRRQAEILGLVMP